MPTPTTVIDFLRHQYIANIPNTAATTVQNFEKALSVPIPDVKILQDKHQPSAAMPVLRAAPKPARSWAWHIGREPDIRGTGWTNPPLLQRPGLRAKKHHFDVTEKRQLKTSVSLPTEQKPIIYRMAVLKPMRRILSQPIQYLRKSISKTRWHCGQQCLAGCRSSEASTYYLQSNAQAYWQHLKVF
jgi:hypothetical protein